MKIGLSKNLDKWVLINDDEIIATHNMKFYDITENQIFNVEDALDGSSLLIILNKYHHVFSIIERTFKNNQ